ncbi:hypothetical protein CLIB1444_24S00276 [[Candida] jaroonii]|uniref:Uncharacterized protein n=1 Tax=[Candida] jaroonii TaxID=467808 RepID=A0ACA9YFT9_9ASCO|nr:hypothetical protein CLIB1444_24S00276 [[Candida] jaroonii]
MDKGWSRRVALFMKQSEKEIHEFERRSDNVAGVFLYLWISICGIFEFVDYANRRFNWKSVVKLSKVSSKGRQSVVTLSCKYQTSVVKYSSIVVNLQPSIHVPRHMTRS